MAETGYAGKGVNPWVLDDTGKVVLQQVDDPVNIDVWVVLVNLIQREGQKLIPDIN